MANLKTKSEELNVAAPSDGPLALLNAKAALVLSVASIALTGAFTFGFGDEARTAANWLMPVGSVAGLVSAALSLRAKPLQGQAWLAGGTLVLVVAAAVSSNVIFLSTALVALCAFATGLAFTSGKMAPAQTQPASADQQQKDSFAPAVFFENIAEIDRRSKVISVKHGNIAAGSMLVEQIHIADRPAFLLACDHASKTHQDLTLRLMGKAANNFEDTSIFLQMQQGKLYVALRTVANKGGNNNSNDTLRELAHELRTPLAAMVGFADALAQNQTCTEEMRQTYPSLIASAGRSLVEMTAAILQQQPENWHAQNLPLKNVVQDCLALLQPMAQQKSIVVFNRLPRSLSEKAVNGTAMRQILINLISNAIKFSPAETSVELSAAHSANGWTLKVTDNGNGLAPEDVARLGQKNFRSEKAAGIAGYGLGLSIVQRLVDKIGGRICFESRPGNGTQVTIAFPAATFVELSSFQPQGPESQAIQSITETKTGEKHAAA